MLRACSRARGRGTHLVDSLKRLLADENVARSLVADLRERGFDVQSVAHIAPAASDDEVFRLAVRERRALLTFDKDFGEITRSRRSHPPAVFLVRTKGLSLSHIRRMTLSALLSIADWKGRFVVITPGSVRTQPFRKRAQP